MTTMKAILTIALTLAITIALTTHINTKPVQIQESKQTHHEEAHKPLAGPTTTTTPKKRVSRFLAEDKERNPRAADHCHKDGEVCAATNTTCCNNKCFDLHFNSHNCGKCKHQCEFTEVCCRGKCVDLSFDKRFCGSCHNKCLEGQFCIYGMCDYA